MRTPALVMNSSAVEAAYHRFTAAMPSIDVHYAMKCNPQRGGSGHAAVTGVPVRDRVGPGLDLLLTLGVDPETVLYSNPVKPGRTSATRTASGVRCFAFDSLDEAGKLAALAPGSNAPVRLNASGARSGVPSEGSSAWTRTPRCGSGPGAVARTGTQFGVAFHVVRDALPEERLPPLVAVRSMMHRLADMGIFLQMVDLGGGFPARYGAVCRRARDLRASGLDALPYRVRAVVEPTRHRRRGRHADRDGHRHRGPGR